MSVVRKHCTCGASMAARGHVGPAVEAWEHIHTGDGHGDATAAQASRARRKAEAEELRREGWNL